MLVAAVYIYFFLLDLQFAQPLAY